ncbi:NAD(P)H-dependent oxidoreductase [Sporanaerobacter acetigenes]|uniref:NAD(P)H-dependent oxidoreductase n=1 Tax=Sporanaerobacter acetigenes TaxID=165813 RepID=UPI003332AEAF
MLRMNRVLKELSEQNESIKVAIIGAGKMGRGLVNQMSRIKGMIPSIVVNRNVEKAIYALELAGIRKEDIAVSNSVSETNAFIEEGKYVVSEYIDVAVKANEIQAVVDATGVPEAGAEIAMAAIKNHKHIIMLNVEADSVVGPILYRYAKEEGVVYTGTAGDEPGAAIELYDFAVGLGFEVLAMGKGKNNPVDFSANPDTVYKEAIKKELKPNMLAGFIDGTNTMIELNCMGNATGFVPDIRGCHGIESNINDLKDHLRLKKDGGVLESFYIVDYVRGIAPGVYLLFTTDLEEIHSQLEYLKMGSGPNYLLYRPYHLTSLETPFTIYNACVNNESTIAPICGAVADTITVAKKDLKAGDTLDGIGGYTVYGSLEKYEIAKSENLVPIGLINDRTVVTRNVKKGEFITYDMIDLDESTLLYELRQKQEKCKNMPKIL